MYLEYTIIILTKILHVIALLVIFMVSYVINYLFTRFLLKIFFDIPINNNILTEVKNSLHQLVIFLRNL